MSGQAVELTIQCPQCGEKVVLTGTVQAKSNLQFSLVTDAAGTITAWDHQAKHDKET